MLPDTVSVTELVFVTLALTLSGYFWWHYQEALRSRHYWESKKMNGVTDLSTRSSVRNARILFMVSILIVFIGFTAMSIPKATYIPDVEPGWVLLINPLLAITVVALLLLGAVLNRSTREDLIALEVARDRRDKLIATYGITIRTSDEELHDIARSEQERRTVPRLHDMTMLAYLTDIRERLRVKERESGR